jgi:hypothetical protein
MKFPRFNSEVLDKNRINFLNAVGFLFAFHGQGKGPDSLFTVADAIKKIPLHKAVDLAIGT